MNELLALDQRLFVLINQTFTFPIFDVVMPVLTDFDNWRTPLIVFLILVFARASAETLLRGHLPFVPSGHVIAVTPTILLASAGAGCSLCRQRGLKS